jgi:hypothetical protein
MHRIQIVRLSHLQSIMLSSGLSILGFSVKLVKKGNQEMKEIIETAVSLYRYLYSCILIIFLFLSGYRVHDVPHDPEVPDATAGRAAHDLWQLRLHLLHGTGQVR